MNILFKQEPCTKCVVCTIGIDGLFHNSYDFAAYPISGNFFICRLMDGTGLIFNF